MMTNPNQTSAPTSITLTGACFRTEVEHTKLAEYTRRHAEIKIFADHGYYEMGTPNSVLQLQPGDKVEITITKI